MGWESYGVVRFDLGPLLQGQTWIAKLKSAYNLLIIGPRSNNILVWLDLTLGTSFKVKRGYPNLKVLITCLLLVLEVCKGKPTYRTSWASNLLMYSDFTLFPPFIGQTRIPKLRSAYSSLIIGPRGL